jgi:hypothetical protein
MMPYYLRGGEVIDLGSFQFICNPVSGEVRLFEGDLEEGQLYYKIPDKVGYSSCVLVSTEFQELWLVYGGGIVNKIPNHMIGKDCDVFPLMN